VYEGGSDVAANLSGLDRVLPVKGDTNKKKTRAFIVRGWRGVSFRLWGSQGEMH